jgi:hypothetical protein
MSNQEDPTLFDVVVKMNAKGILLMLQGKHVQATACFRRGMKKLLAGLSEERPAGESFSGATPLSGNSFNPGQFFPYKQVDEGDAKEYTRILFSVGLPEEKCSVMQDDVFVLFNRALHISSETAHVEDNECSIHILTAVLLYNLGITFHQKGLKTGDSQALSRALRFYSMAHETLAVAENTSLTETSNGLALGLLAVANNIGHVHAHFQCFEEAGVCSDDLSFRLSIVLDAPILSEAEAQVFILNAWFFRKTQLASTPAACTNPS